MYVVLTLTSTKHTPNQQKIEFHQHFKPSSSKAEVITCVKFHPILRFLGIQIHPKPKEQGMDLGLHPWASVGCGLAIPLFLNCKGALWEFLRC
jgi:hypothetical protein